MTHKQMTHKFIVAIGTNFNREAHAEAAKLWLAKTFAGLRFSRQLLTEPLGDKPAGGERFLNFLAYGHTEKSCDATVDSLKRIETLCGNSADLRRQGKIAIDIDLLLYGNSHHHADDWQRGYIQQLLGDVDFNKDAKFNKQEK